MSPQHSFVAFSCSLLLILCLTVDASPKSVEEFNEWLKKDGHFPSELLEVSLSANGQRGLGVFAKQQLKRGLNILRIPADKWISAKDLPAELKPYEEYFPTQLDKLAMLLLFHQYSGTSEYQPWIRLLPFRSESTLFWSESELKEIEGTGIVEATAIFKQRTVSVWNRAKEFVFDQHIQMFPLGHYRFLNYLYACQLVMSRSFLVHGIEDEPIRVLLPFYDMFNHASREDGGATVMFAGGEMRIVLSKQIQPGEEIFLDYGGLTTKEMMLYHGFLPQTIPGDSFTVVWRSFLNESTSYQTFLSHFDVLNHNLRFQLTADKFPNDLLWKQRAMHVSFKELSRVEELVKENRVVSLTNELHALRASMTLLQRQMRSIPSQQAEDLSLLRDGWSELSHNRVLLAAKARVNVRTILANNLSLMREAWLSILKKGKAVPNVVSKAQPFIDVKWRDTARSNFTKHQPLVHRNKVPVGIAITTCSRGRTINNVMDLPLLQVSIPTLLQSFTEHDLETYDIRIFIGFDRGDPWYDNVDHAMALKEALRASVAKYGVSFKLLRLTGTDNSPPRAWSQIMNYAFHDNCEYLYQVNDDIHFDPNETKEDWLQLFVDALRESKIFPNFGVTGPVDMRRALLTQAFVHRIHLEIFPDMYPHWFQNWYNDDWLELVYRPHNKPIKSCVIINTSTSPRYAVDPFGHRGLNRLLKDGCKRIRGWLAAQDLPERWQTADSWACTQVNTKEPRPGYSTQIVPYSVSYSKLFASSPANIVELQPKQTEPKDRDLLSEFLKKRAIGNTIVVTFTNYAFIDFVYNWLVFVQYHQIQNYVVIAFDQKSYDELREQNIITFYNPALTTSEDAQTYLKGDYKKLVNLKTRYNYEILARGYDTLLSDSDICFLKNPFDFLTSSAELQIQDDSKDGIQPVYNTGFQLMRSTTETIAFYARVVKATQHTDLQDQRAYNQIMRSQPRGFGFKVHFLDRMLFPNGWVQFNAEEPRRKGVDPVIVHVNWITGHDSKKFRLKENMLWLSEPSDYYINSEEMLMTYNNDHPDIDSSEKQQAALLSALLVAKVLRRTLILPRFRIFGSYKRYFHSDREYCTAEMLHEMDLLLEAFPYIKENSFLKNKYVVSDPRYNPLENALVVHIHRPGEPQYAGDPQHVLNDMGLVTADRNVFNIETDIPSPRGLPPFHAMNWLMQNNRPLVIFHNILGKIDFSDSSQKERRAVCLRLAPNLQCLHNTA